MFARRILAGAAESRFARPAGATALTPGWEPHWPGTASGLEAGDDLCVSARSLGADDTAPAPRHRGQSRPRGAELCRAVARRRRRSRSRRLARLGAARLV